MQPEMDGSIGVERMDDVNKEEQKMVKIIGFDGEVMQGATRKERVEQIKTYLGQWMQKGDIIAWHTDENGDDEGMPNCAVVFNAEGIEADASARIVQEN